MFVLLCIDTSAINTAKIALEIDGKRYEKVSESKVFKSQMTLPMIEELLNEHKLALKDITEIIVATGPGSFTGLRVGATVANALGYLLHIPVNGKKALAIPIY
jgi:tRNA threonylcarbamoyladenosine biosynthesis protein TsaB